MELAGLAELSFFQGMPKWALVRLAEVAAEQEVAAGQMVLCQADRARAVHFLLAGSVQIQLRVGEEDLLVAVVRRPGELLGWSAFRAPYRYTASVRAEEPSRLLRLPAAASEELFDRDPRLRLPDPPAGGSGRHQPPRADPPAPVPASRSGRSGGGHAVSAAEALQLLTDAPFFEGFDRGDLAELSRRARMVAVDAGTRVFTEGEPATAFYLLASGAVEIALSVRPAGARSTTPSPTPAIRSAGHSDERAICPCLASEGCVDCTAQPQPNGS